MAKKAKKSKKKSKKKAKKKTAKSKIILPKGSVALEIYMLDGIIYGIRCDKPLSYRIVDLSLADENFDKAPSVAYGYLLDKGQVSHPQYVENYLNALVDAQAEE